MSTAEPRPCPVCDGVRKTTLYRQRFAAIDGATLLDGFDVVVCEACGMAFADGIPPQAHFDDYYRRLSKYEGHERVELETEWDARRFRDIAELIVSHARSPDDRVLEVGCATGALLAHIRDLGMARVCGRDPSPHCARVAADQLGISVAVGTLSDMRPSDGEFDFVVLVGVLEHVRDLDAALAQIAAVTGPAARLYLEVPDALAFADHLDAPYQQFSVEHINFFTRASLGNLLSRAGWTPVVALEAARPATSTSVMPVVAAVFEHTGQSEPPVRDDRAEGALRRYVERSRALHERIVQPIDELVAAQEPVVVWGVGVHTTRLLQTSALGRANIVAYIDSNPKVQGRQLDGIPIVEPRELARLPHAVLISSRVFQTEIARTIREQLGLPNRLIVLYGGEREPERSP